MAIATYSDLQTDIAAYLARSGDTLVSTPAPDFVLLAENRITYGADDDNTPFPSRPLRIRAMEVSTSLAVHGTTTASSVGGTANAITLTNATPVTSLTVGDKFAFTATSANTAATTLQVDALAAKSVVIGSARAALVGGEILNQGNYKVYWDGTNMVLMPDSADVPLPANFLAMRSNYLDTTPRKVLDYMTPEQLSVDNAWNLTGQPYAFTIEQDCVRFDPAPDGPYEWVLLFYQKFPALASAAGGVNWLMTNAASVYLYGSLLEAAIYFGMDDIKRFHALFLSAINGLQAQDERDRHSGVPLVMRPRGMIP